MTRYWLGKKRPDLVNTNAVNTMFKKGQISPNKGKKFSLETRAKLSISHKGQISALKGKSNPYRGEKHWNWKGGITQKRDPQRVRFSKYFQKKVFQRDNYTCQQCQCEGGKLQVDHIKPWALYPKLRFNLSNCRTLCMQCHYFVTFGKKLLDPNMTWGHNFKRRVSI